MERDLGLHGKLLKGIIEDLMKMPMHGAHGPKEMHVEAEIQPKQSALDPDGDGDAPALDGEHDGTSDKHKKEMRAMFAKHSLAKGI